VDDLSANRTRQSDLFNVVWIERLSGLLGMHAEMTAVEHHDYFGQHKFKKAQRVTPMSLG
jgi:cytidine deaminase